ncbi:hypothetical protein [Roseofilum capinflatum]|uniref:Uncharacterized protein n=1 Tax=Roseofilum capinflatum BLCC-M114 TaxID=3022440 RepID=A0ABT7B4D8_9CYAN|nr:hypothetical protein [Roseofilum capinflatum]MDJ1174005.1 hypothetical protein [Roseofilum capinflatum BLCC-M114]MDJ1177070.1 hypothetical protein [Roseofilum capinflatum BLCC-M114]
MQRFLRLDGFTRAERIGMTYRVSEAINQAGAWITNFHLYSNLLICINFQVPIANLNRLAATLQETGLQLSQESLEQLMLAHDSTLKEQELVGTLQITFVHNEPDLLRDIPAVPG